MTCPCKTDWRHFARNHLAILHVELGRQQQCAMDLTGKLDNLTLDEYAAKVRSIHQHISTIVPEVTSAEEQLRQFDEYA